jgi:hypothetical protein
MASHNNVEVIVISTQSSAFQNQKELVKWLTTILQPAIDKQQINIRKMFLKNWTHTPAIYLS